jgi:Protein of unknown function (DUF4241)
VKPELLLDDGARHKWPDDGAESVLRVAQVTTLACPTGSIAAGGIESVIGSTTHSADFADLQVLAVPAGEYPLTLSIASFPPNEYFPDGFERVAAAALRFRPNEVRVWRRTDQVLDIDAGTGCFFDVANSSAVKALSSQPDADLAVIGETLDNRFTVRPPNAMPAEVAFFECGMGDGGYDFWIGYDDSGDIAMLVVDLELLDHAQPRE